MSKKIHFNVLLKSFYKSIEKFMGQFYLQYKLTLFVSLFIYAPLHANIPQNISFRNYKIEDGLSQSSVFAITQDGDGFMWFGTRNGLNRFDSRRFKVYRNIKGDSTSLASNEINCLTIDKKNRLWVGTRLGLHLYDRISDSFIRISLTQPDKVYSNLESIRGLLSDANNRLWVLSGTRVFISQKENPLLFDLVEIPNPNKSGTRKSVMRNIFEDSSGNIWISNNNHLYKVIHNQLGTIEYQMLEFPLEISTQNLRVNSIAEYPEGKLWIGTESSGVILYDLNTKIQRQYLHSGNESNSLISNKIRSIVIDESGMIWFATVDGLSIFDPITQNFTSIQSDPENELSLSSNSILSAYKDNSGSIWLGTFYGGINFYSRFNFSHNYYKTQNDGSGLSEKIVSQIVEDRYHNLWIGTEGGGLNYYNKTSGRFEYFTTESKRNSVSHKNIKCLLYDSDFNLWIGTSGGGLDILDTKTNKMGYFQNNPKNEKSIGSDWIYSIMEDKENTVWLGTYGFGLDRYLKSTGEFKHYNKNDGDSSISSNSIRSMFLDSDGRAWFGTSNGLCRYDSKHDKFINYFAHDYDSLSLSSDDIYCIQEDKNNRIWIGTYGGGLNYFEEESEHFYSYTVADGLPGNIIYGILEDNNGFLWISTNNGLTRFDPKENVFRNFDSKDGLPGDEYNYNSYYKTTSGELFFGGKNGLISFDPNQISINNFKPNLVLTGLRLFNKKVEIGDDSNLLSQNISSTDEVVLKYNQNIITIEFSCLNFVNPLKNNFAHKLEGLDEDWNFTSSSEATYMNLPSGKYTLLVKGSNNDNIWNDNPARMKIVVMPPYWSSWWAYLIYSLFISGALFLIFSFQRSRSNLNHKLELERLELDRQNELHQLKLKYFTNISHEIRTPLTLILTPLENLLANYKNDSTLYKRLLGIKNNADRLLRLVNQIMDFRKQETGKLKLGFAEGNIVKFIREIKLAFFEEIKQKNLTCNFDSVGEIILVWYDRDEMEKVFFNILSNAVKFTNRGGTITIKSSVISRNSEKDAPDFVEIKISNTGKGIPSEKVDLIFDRFYQVDKQGLTEYGTGIGLALSKGIVELHSGKISVESSVGKDDTSGFTCFTIILPPGKDHIQADHIIENFKNSEAIELYELLNEKDSENQEVNQEIKNKVLPNILLVEDNAEIRKLISDSLKSDFQISEAENGKIGWEIAIESIPDLIISDVVMPEMDGLELCENLKSDNRTSHIPVILLTARTSIINKLQGLKTGADDYLTKPFNIQVLLLRINNLIESRRILREKYSRTKNITPESFEHSSSFEDGFLNKAAEIIDQQMMNSDFSVNKLAGELGMSQSVFYRKLKALTDLSPNEFMKNIRLNKAAGILLRENLNVAEVGYRVGFNDPKYFSRSFKSQFGYTPSEYLKRNKR
ncbi:MAG: response regulator [Bacteroidales bacterium]|nr:response regulator [Bacteroidales bacterium]MCF8390135.1 response regulator [Bacteroidales bacterium]